MTGANLAADHHAALLQTLCAAEFDAARKATYVALDVPRWDQAARLVDALGRAVDGYKVGLELFHGDGPRALQELSARGKRVFLDVKLHDIPNTVAGALRRIVELPAIEMVNVHAAGGPRMMAAARAAVDDSAHGQRPLLIAVTVLTSLDQADLAAVGLTTPVADVVTRLAALAADCGLDGVVASAEEIAAIKHRVPGPFELVVPGTRLAGTDAHDQRRTRTPGEAFASGATRLVLGRAVTASTAPLHGLAAVWEELRKAVPGP